MARYIIKRLLGILPILWGIATVTFFMIRIAPGGPFDSEKQLPPEIKKNIEAVYHLDKPLVVQYSMYMKNLLQGNLGPSFRYQGRSVNEVIGEALPTSALIGFCGLLFACIIGLFLGLLGGTKPNSPRDYLTSVFAFLGVCLPSFAIGPLLVYFFGIKLGWFRVAGLDGPLDLVLPSITLGTIHAAYFSRLVRSGIIEVHHLDFVRTARAKGLKESVIVLRHVLRGALIPAVSYLGPAASAMLTGSLVVETVFNIPGLGRFFVQSALNRDYTMVMGTVLCYGTIILIMNLLVDILYAFLEPKVSYAD